MEFYRISTGEEPVFEITGKLYNRDFLGVDSAPPDPGVGYARIMKSGRKWHDCHQTNSFAEGVYAFSERVAIGVQKAKLKGIEFYPIEFEFSENKRLRIKDAPPYCWGLVTGRVGLLESSGESTQPIFEMNMSDWDGSDFVAFKGRKMGFRFVSERFVDLISKNGWTGFHLLKMKEGHILDLNIFNPPVKFPFEHDR